MDQEQTPLKFPELLWAGSEHSLELARDAHAHIMAGPMKAGYPGSPEDEEELPYMLSVQGDVGVIAIRGPLVNSDSPYNKYYGISGYPDIRRALIHAAKMPEVKGILLDIASGGGAVSGVDDTGNLIKMINGAIKPVWAYTDGPMCSAAYWLGCSGGQVYCSKTSIVGSIGVILTHMEYSKYFKEAGIGVSVIRAGKYKALANSFEPLSDTARKQLEDQLGAAYDVFISHVADARGTSVQVADERMGQGREFFGDQALQAGLVDGIASFDAVFSKLQARALDKGGVTLSNNGQYLQGTPMTKKALTEQEIAALASGAAVDPKPAAEPAAETTAPAPAAETKPEPAAAPAPETKPESVTSADDKALVTVLQSQLAAAQTQVVDLRVQVSTLEKAAAGAQAVQGPLLEIARKSLSNMKVALGHSGFDASALSAETLVAEHKTTAETFATKFRAGGVAAVSAKPGAEPQAGAAMDPLHARKVAATRLNPAAN